MSMSTYKRMCNHHILILVFVLRYMELSLTNLHVKMIPLAQYNDWIDHESMMIGEIQ